MAELGKNLNKAEYLDIEQFGKVNCHKVCEERLKALQGTLMESEG